MIDRDELSAHPTTNSPNPPIGSPWLPPMAAEYLPRLPAATPSAVRKAPIDPSALPILVGVDKVVPGRHATSPRRARRRVAVAGCVLLIAGAVAASILARHSSDRSTVEPAAGEISPGDSSAGGQQPSSSAVATTLAVAAAVPSTLAVPTTILATVPTTIPATVAPPPPTIVAEGPPNNDAYMALVDRCRFEQKQVFASLQGFMNETGATPNNPDALANIGWLAPNPDGWSPRWEFKGIDGYIYVLPVPGGLCDVAGV